LLPANFSNSDHVVRSFLFPGKFKKEPPAHSRPQRLMRKRPRLTDQKVLPVDDAATANRRMKLVLPARLLAVIVYGARVAATLGVPVMTPLALSSRTPPGRAGVTE
jgi:hypothetical protein